jgi:hypothetical protein
MDPLIALLDKAGKMAYKILAESMSILSEILQ